MAKYVIIDSSFLVGLLLPRDKYHKTAKKQFKELKDQKIMFILSDYILDESLTIILNRTNCQILEKNIEVIETLLATEIFLMRFLSKMEISEAQRTMVKYCDHNLSFTDVTLLILKRSLKTNEVLSFDNNLIKIANIFS